MLGSFFLSVPEGVVQENRGLFFSLRHTISESKGKEPDTLKAQIELKPKIAAGSTYSDTVHTYTPYNCQYEHEKKTNFTIYLFIVVVLTSMLSFSQLSTFTPGSSDSFFSFTFTAPQIDPVSPVSQQVTV